MTPPPMIGQTMQMFHNRPAVDVSVVGFPAPIPFIVDTGYNAFLGVTRFVAETAGRAFRRGRIRVKVGGGGTRRRMDTCIVDINWFGETRELEAVVLLNYGLIGAALLQRCRLEVDFPSRKVSIALSP